MAAAIETLRQIRESDYLERIRAYGERLRQGLEKQAASYGFGLRQTGPVVMPQVLFKDDPDFRLGYGWVTECLKRGVYFHPYHNLFVSAAHGEAELRATREATDLAFQALKQRKSSLEPHALLLEHLGLRR